eukprot:CAMPEP_0113455066 /NCGR_PEP_ID=MMETSP0014_2-20120614/8185_1 /TAXON_ID=2857 /ORGANISM="Nitzschia sp." /LENGTH=196 /DNA_ID=CAMNT_0000346487 /DNA_START=285 /DNA_END=875 /DNA_ORIENTATION=- /assembly_acc=CAM_ASM_000159
MALSATVPTMNHQQYHHSCSMESSSSSSSAATLALEKELRRLARQESTSDNSAVVSVDMVKQVSNRLCSFHFDSNSAERRLSSMSSSSSMSMIHWDSASSQTATSDESSFVSESSMDSWDNFLADFDEVTASTTDVTSSSIKGIGRNTTSLGKRGRDQDLTSLLSTATITPSTNAKRGRMVRCKKIKSNLASLTNV